MRGLAFLAWGGTEIAFELWQQPLRFLCEALSEYFPLWLIQGYQNSTTPTYQMELWNSRGREIAFWGAWESDKAARMVAAWWQAEGFEPVGLIGVTAQALPVFQRWVRRFRVPGISLTSVEVGRIWPDSGLQEPAERLWRYYFLMPVDERSSEQACRITEELAAGGAAVVFVGNVGRATPFRRLESRYGQRVRAYLGLSWLDVESLLPNCRAVVLPAPRPLYLGLSWGCPILYPGPLPWPQRGAYSYESLEELRELLAQRELTFVPRLSGSQLISAWLKWYKDFVSRRGTE